MNRLDRVTKRLRQELKLPAALKNHAKARDIGSRLKAIPFYAKLSIGIVLIAVASLLAMVWNHHQLYRVSAASSQLLAKSSVDAKKVKETSMAVSYNKIDDRAHAESVTIAGPTDATGATGYQAVINKDYSSGMTFGDSNGKLKFSLTPLFSANKGHYDDGQMMFPLSQSSQVFQTFKKNGIKEDIILTKAPGKTAQWQWRLDLGDKLTAKLLPNGGIGLFSASPYLYDDLQVGDSMSQALVDKAKTNDKSYLAFELPAPYIKDSQGHTITEDVSFKLEGNTLTLEARDLTNQHYPISIDPTVVVTTTADFRGGYDDGSIDYSGSGQISRGAISTGSVGSNSSQLAAFTSARTKPNTVAYKGFLYIVGGIANANDTGCNANANCTDVQYAVINSDGSLSCPGTCPGSTIFSQQLAAFSVGRFKPTVAVYNGFLYVIGGGAVSSATGCNVSSNFYCGDVQYAVINSDGSLSCPGSCPSGKVFAQQTGKIAPRADHDSAIYNGRLYISGGLGDASSAGCDAAGKCNDIQYCPINADGSVGTCTQQTSAFNTPRIDHAMVAYNGFLYITGGNSAASATGCDAAGRCGDVLYSVINSDGSLSCPGSCTLGVFVQQLTAFTTPRYLHTSVAAKGYLYIVGGNGAAAATGCPSTTRCSDVQYSVINSDGSLSCPGTCTTGVFTQQLTAFTTARFGHASAYYDGYIYIVGGNAPINTGCDASSHCSDVQRLPVNTGTPSSGATSGSTTQTTTAFTTPRTKHATVAYNGYLYVIGGNGTASGAGCDASNYCSDIQYATMNSNGSLSCPSGKTCSGGTVFTQQLNALANARRGMPAVVHNGYLYIIGGSGPTASAGVGCSVAARCTDIQRCRLNTDGSIGDGTSGNVECTQQLSRFGPGRNAHAAVVYQDYIYITGGKSDPSASSNCDSNGNCNDIQYCQIASDDTVNTCTLSSTTIGSGLNRSSHNSVAYNGYLYVVAGLAGASATGCDVNGLCDDIIRCPINPSTHDVSTCTQQTGKLPSKRWTQGNVAYNGYLYTIGGCTSGNSTCSGFATDIQYCQINSTGDIGTCTTQTAVLSNGRTAFGNAVYNGFAYVTGGNQASGGGITGCDTGGRCNDVMYTSLKSPAQTARYERIIDTTSTSSTNIISSIAFSGSMVCGGQLSYATADSSGAFGSMTKIPYVTPGTTYPLNVAAQRYLWIQILMDDSQCGTNSYITDLTVNYNSPTAVPTLSAPANTSTVASTTPALQFNSTDPDSEDVSYEVQVDTNSSFNSSTDSYNQSNQDNDEDAGVNTEYVAQSFTGNGKKVSAAQLYLKKLGAPTGSFSYSIYATSGTNGTSAVPTGAALATSDTYEGTNLTTSYQLISLPFSGSNQITLSNGNTYAIVINPPSGASPGNKVFVGVDASSPTHVGNFATRVGGSWTASSSEDAVFYINTNLDKTSGTDTGFTGSPDNTDPFASGQTVSYTVQAGDALTRGTTYYWRVRAKDPSGSNTWSSYSAPQSFTVNSIPNAPTLSTPSSGQTGVLPNPEFRLSSTDADNDYLRYRFIICNTSNTSLCVWGGSGTDVLQSIDQTSSQTGWKGQDTDTAHAYVSGTVAIHTLQTALSANTTYYWRAYAIDPNGSNTWSSASGIGTFSTSASPQININVGGGTTINSGTTIGQ